MKTIALTILGLLIVICFGLLLAFNKPEAGASVPQDQELTGKEEHQVDLVTALGYIKNHKESLKAQNVKGGFMARGAFEKILAQPGVIGIRYYYAKMDDGSPTLVLVGVDAKGKDIKTGAIMERIWPCPPFCDAASELAQ